MKIQTVNNNITFGNTSGGIKYLQITGEGSNIKFTEVPQEISDVGVFVAGGEGIDKEVLRARLKAAQQFENKQIVAKHESKFIKLFKKLISL